MSNCFLESPTWWARTHPMRMCDPIDRARAMGACLLASLEEIKKIEKDKIKKMSATSTFTTRDKDGVVTMAGMINDTSEYTPAEFIARAKVAPVKELWAPAVRTMGGKTRSAADYLATCVWGGTFFFRRVLQEYWNRGIYPDLSTQDDDGNTVFHTLAHSSIMEFYDLLFNPPYNSQQIKEAAIKTNNAGETVLHSMVKSCGKGWTPSGPSTRKSIDLLVLNGLDLGAKNKDGKTAFDLCGYEPIKPADPEIVSIKKEIDVLMKKVEELENKNKK